MAQKNQTFSIKGMQRDLSESVFSSEYAFDNRNIRFTATDNNNSLALVNERGTEELSIEGLEEGFKGIPIGQCVLNKYLVVFTTNNEGEDIIYLVKQDKDKYTGRIFYSGNLNFNTSNPIEAYPYYENEELQKIYWVDGKNPFRFINIANEGVADNLINAVPTMQLTENISIAKRYHSGMFAPGVIQYCFTYIKKYAQESAIFYTSPLYYITYKNRGGNGEDKISNSFSIKLSNLDTSFDYVRVYAIHRTSIDSEASTRIVADLSFTSSDPSVSIIDTGTIGESTSTTDLLFKTGEQVIPSTLNSKSNTLFLGNIKSEYNSIPDEVAEKFATLQKVFPVKFRYTYEKDKKTYPLKNLLQTPFTPSSAYQYQSNLDYSSQKVKMFKYGEWYRLGVQVQYKTGKWSDVIYLTDCKNNLPPTVYEGTDLSQTRGRLYSDFDNMFAVPAVSIPNSSSYTEDVLTDYTLRIITVEDLEKLEEYDLHWDNRNNGDEYDYLLPRDSDGNIVVIVMDGYTQQSLDDGTYYIANPFTLKEDENTQVLSDVINTLVTTILAYELNIQTEVTTVTTEIANNDTSDTVKDTFDDINSGSVDGSISLVEGPGSLVNNLSKWSTKTYYAYLGTKYVTADATTLLRNIIKVDISGNYKDYLLSNVGNPSKVTYNTEECYRWAITITGNDTDSAAEAATQNDNKLEFFIQASVNGTEGSKSILLSSFISYRDINTGSLSTLDTVVKASKSQKVGRILENGEIVDTSDTEALEDLNGEGGGSSGRTITTTETITNTIESSEDSSTASMTDEAKTATEELQKAWEAFNNAYNKTTITTNLGEKLASYLIKELDAVKIRPVIVYPDYNDRSVICQGVVEPTVYNVNDRYNNLPFAQSSWISRINPPYRYLDSNNSSSTEPRYTFSFYITVYTSFHKSSSSIDIANGSYTLQGGKSTSDNLLVTLTVDSDSDDPITLGGTDQVQALCSVTTTVSELENWLYAVCRNLGVGNYRFTTKGKSVPNRTVKSYRVLDALGNRFTSYLRWVPVFNGENSVGEVVNLTNINKGNDSGDNTAITVGSLAISKTYISLPEYDSNTASTDEGAFATAKDCGIVRDSVDSEGAIAEFRHNFTLPDNLSINAEIQSLGTATNTKGVITDDASKEDWKGDNENHYYIDQNIVTIHSPELEFDDTIQNTDFSNVKFRIVGMVPVVANTSFNTISVDGGPALKRYWTFDSSTNLWSYKTSDSTFVQADGVLNKNIQTNMFATDNRGYKSRITNALWNDVPFALQDEGFEYTDSDGNVSTTKTLDFVTYLWHRNGPLNNDTREKDTTTNWLKYKRTSNLHYSNRNAYLPEDFIWYADTVYNDYNTGVDRGTHANAALFNSNEITVVKVKDPYTEEGLVYYGNVDSVIYPDLEKNVNGYEIVVSKADNSGWDNLLNLATPENKLESTYTYSTLGVRMKYKSTPHAVVALPRQGDNTLTILPTFRVEYLGNKYLLNPSSVEGSAWWDDTLTNTAQEGILLYSKSNNYYPSIDFSGPDETLYGPQFGWLWLGELYKEVDEESRFGGNNKEALAKNVWYPCGKSITLTENMDSIDLVWEEGDTFYQRYDHIKTYPFTLEDQNSVTDIVSFMVETHVNIDGRYDRNRGNKDNTLITSENFNQMNEVYSQTNNLFSYYYRNPELLDLDTWTNNVTWTLTKTAGDLVDKWTHITLASTLDLDGSYGAITSLQKYNDQLLAFQERAISMIMYNENMQLTTTDGVPVEIGNSGKVNGYRIVTDTAGCANKHTIVSTENGIYFVDNLNKIAYLFKDGKVNNLSLSTGMSSWFNTNTTDSVWNPMDWDNMISYYNPLTNDLLYITKNEAVAFNLTLSNFTSFYSYERVPYMAHIDEDTLAINNGYLHRLNTGDYNYFFGSYQPFSTEIIANADRLMDKTFTNVDFRSETGAHINGLWEDYSDITFNTISSSNEYQTNTETLVFKKYGQSNLKRKFRIWRANIPRDSKFKRDRMRNPWLHLKLQMNKRVAAKDTTEEEKALINKYNKSKTILHDLNVIYYV